ncbi:hypothetical protein [Rhodocaloribacter sp.]
MTPEEYQRIKEAEKEHLRKLKALKRTVRRLERQKKLNQALENITGGRERVLDTHEEMMEQLAMETALSEARLEMALEAEQAVTEAEARAAMEEDLQKARARELIRRIKLEVGSSEAAPDPPSRRAKTSPAEAPAEPEPDAPAPPQGLPEKTIGRMKP